MEPIVDTAERARILTQALKAGGWTAADIARHFGGSVSLRTVYRWLKGDSGPQRSEDLQTLEELARTSLHA
jgi:transcriptional regulator with XRE-family HTH domain